MESHGIPGIPWNPMESWESNPTLIPIGSHSHAHLLSTDFDSQTFFPYNDEQLKDDGKVVESIKKYLKEQAKK